MAKEIANSDRRLAASSNGSRKPVEETLANIWASVLRLPHVDTRSNFFEIGGDSLKAMEVIGRVREVLQVDLPLISFFEDPTVNHLAEVLSGERTELEDALVNIWQEVLRLPHIDKDANFFEIGGDSLKAMEVIARVGEVLHVDLPLIAFFEQPTIRHLADVISNGQESTETRLANIWKEVLRVSQVEKDSNFFDIGGDSLKAMEVVVRVSEVLHVDLPLIAFFEEPTIAHLAAVVDGLKATGTTPPIARVADRQEFPLSYSQQVFWLLEQQNPGTGIYNKPRVFRIHGRVDPMVMERSLNELRQRHEILRARFVSGVNGPVQVVDAGGSLRFAVTDLSSQDPRRREQMAMKLALETVRKPLDLASGQAQRAHLIQLSDEEFILCIAEHHVVNDGFTGSILLDELGAVYDAFAAGEPNPLPPIELHYTDYAVWERQWMQGERLAGEIEYWRSILSDAPTSVELPTDSSTSQEPDRRGRLRSMTVPPASLQRLQASAQANGTTQFTVLSAALRLLLYRWSGQADFLLGTTASNRSRSGTERMIGPFVNPLPIRNPIADGQSVLDLLNSEKKAVMEAFAHQDCPFAKIVEAVNPARTSNDNPLFNVGLVMENFPEIELKGRHFEAEYLNFDPETALLDLRFVAIEKHGGLRFSCEYKSALFSPETVDALLQAYADVLDATASDPEKRIDEFRVPEVLARQVAASSLARKRSIAVAATYTAEPLKEPLEFWLRQLGMPPKIEFALFNQVFQQLLDPNSLLANNQYGANVVLVRMEDLHEADALEAAKGLDSVVDELLAALRGAARHSAVPYFILIGPPSESVRGQVELARAIERAEEKLVDGGREIEGVRVISSRELLSLYPVAAYADDYTYQVSHIPYRPALFNALATMIARCICAARRVAHEVIVLDCDNVLWSVAASERGSMDTGVDAPHGALQDFMVAQENAGMILCLVGGDTEANISAKLESTAGMRLGWQNFASSRFGVRAKSDGLNGLAGELGLALDRFIFVTSDPIDAAEVRANCACAVVAELPADAASIPAFLANFWAFDRRVDVATRQTSLRTPPDLLDRVATQFTNVAAITQAIDAAKVMRGRESHAYTPPRSPVEEFLADVWARLLRIERPSIHDNFFALGGHSLMAAQVIARVRQTLGVELSLRAMFEAPTIAGFAGLIETERRARSGVVVPPITRVPREGELPLSFAQQRLWFIDQLEPGSALYNLASMYRMRGKLHASALERTINEIVRRHESLRTTFRNVEGHPMSVVAPELVIPLPLAQVAGGDEQRREAELRRLALAEATEPFDLAAGPLFRARLLRVGEDDHALLIIVHHIVGDGWSGSLIAGEMAAIYGAFVQDSPSPLPELAIQYADFAAWQRQWLQGDVQDRQVDYWRQQLAGAPPLLELPTDRPRLAAQRHRGALQTCVLSPELVDRLWAFSRGEGATLFMTLLAAFQLLLSRYSGQEDVVVGSPIAGRNYADIEPLIGFFVNTLALRTDLSGDPTFRELLARVKRVTLEGHAHQDIPFEKLVEELQPERNLSYNPIFQVTFGLQNMPRQVFQASGLRVERTPVHQETSTFDMAWFAWETDEGLLLRVEYDSDLFEAATIDRALGHFDMLLAGIAAHPEKRISEFPLLTSQERQQLLVEWNATEADYPRDLCLHELIARQARQSPDRIATLCGTRQMTYGDLHRRSNQLARYLQKHGVGPDVLVGLMVSRSSDLPVAILGVLKAGGTYVPLDPIYPKDRIGVILDDTSAPVLLTDEALSNGLPESRAERIYVDSGWPAIAHESADDLSRSAGPENLAYVLYTSGSTGKPKGAQIEHRNVVNFLASMLRKPGLRENDVWLAVTTLSFDFSVLELFLPLLVGAKVVLASREQASDPEQLKNLLAGSKTTAMSATPATWRMLIESHWDGVPGLKLFCGGEALTPDLANQLLPRCGELWNVYGPTETTVCSNLYRVTSELTQVVPIGVPNYNVTMYLLDLYGQPVPIGIPGELYIGGAGVARGYQNRPELTEERFLASPFRKGERVYRTGDIASYLPDGNLRFHGRTDFQVKIRGFRIELGEIEAVLGQHPAVKECVVVVFEDRPGNKSLAAYVVPQPDNSRAIDMAMDESERASLIDELRRWLTEKLPKYMVPAAFVVMDGLPLSPNGKINRRALPAPGQSRDTAATYVAPRTPLEETLAKIWRDVLHVDKVGVNDNFFSLGGHSLLATQVVSRIRQAANVELPLRHLFEWPTIAELGLAISELKASQAVVLPPIQAAPRDQALPLSFAQQRLWFLNQLDPDSPVYNIPMTLRLSGVLQVEPLKRALNEIVRRHEVLRTRYVVDHDLPIQVIDDEVEIELPIEDLTAIPLEAREPVVQQLAVENFRYVFNLRTGPVFRTILLRLGERDHVLLMNTHHIVSDGWSIWRFLSEMATLYEAFLEGRPSPLPDLPIQYADFVVWQRAWLLKSDIFANQLAYWKKQLDGAPNTVELSTDYPRPSVQNFRGAMSRVTFPRSLGEKLSDLASSEGVTLYMTLLAAFQILLFRYSGQEDFTVGTPIANRIHSEIEDLIGFFVNTIVMRSKLSGNPTVRELLHRVRDTALGAYSNQDLPFERLVEELQPERDLSRMPLFQVLFVLQNAPRTDFRLPGINIVAMDVHNGTSKFDIGMFMFERPEGLACSVEYSTELFSAGTIQRLLSHYQLLLEAIVEDPSRQVSELSLLTDEERRQVVVAWNDTHRDLPQGRLLHQFIEQQAESTPNRIALICGDEEISYGDLNARANQLAHYLIKHGAGPELLIGVYSERNANMLVAILGILKSGSAYVPLDPNFPKQRIQHILDDAKATLVVTQRSIADELPDFEGHRICLDSEWSLISPESTANPAASATPENLAYVLFTSGSTGRPKGVAIEHHSAATFIHWAREVFTPEELSGVLLSTSMCFDLSIFEIFVPLGSGGAVILAKNALYLPTLAAKDKVTLINTVPSAMAELLNMDGVPDSVKTVNLAGEALPDALVEHIYGATKAERVYNLYGPTEDTTYSTYTLVRRGTAATVGRPIANSQAYILDTYLNPVPAGVPGELYLAGEGLARGYYGRPDLTSERFVPNPFNTEPGARMYRTGDLARFLPDSNIEYLGRIDHQVKIRGFRIELGEIETALDTHPAIRQSVVLAREDEPGNKRLVAYVVADPHYHGSEHAGTEEARNVEQVSQWATTFDEAYRSGGDAADATFNISGWNSSYTGEPIPPEEMRVWVESTTERILALRAKRVWEIGCGTGLLLFRVAPACEHYHGTDISQAALNFLQQQLQRSELKLPNVTLERKAAHELDSGAAASFDAVVLNSVAQYFPNLEYLVTVIEGAVRSLRPGGALFLGDLRSFPLLETFHASVQLFQGEDSTTRDQFWKRVQNSVRKERELLIDPNFFAILQQRIPAISRVEVQLKRGRAQNELTRFRYDVVLHVGTPAVPGQECAWLNWKAQKCSTEQLREILHKAQPEIIGITGIPNARLAAEIEAAHLLRSSDGPDTLGEVREILRQSPVVGVEPEDLFELAKDEGYTAEIRASVSATDGCLDVVFRRENEPDGRSEIGVPKFPGETGLVRPWETYASNPLRQTIELELVPQLRSWLGDKLPEFMVPSTFVVMDAMPLSANGKINRKALPVPQQSRTKGLGNYQAPQTPMEEIVAGIFIDVLHLERVGSDDNLFDLGGHSLSATQVVSRIRQNLRADLPVRAVFESPTVATLAQAVDRNQRTQQGLVAPPIERVPRDQRLPLSFAQQRLWVLDQIEPNNSLYNVPKPLRFTGALNIAALETALNGIVARHEVLRTTYGSSKGKPFQVIAEEVKQPLKVIDLCGLPVAPREKEAHRIVEQEASTPFDLATDPIMRYVLITMDDEDHILMMTTHHIADDGWSSGVLLRELTELYEAALNNNPASLPELLIQYADYAVWQRNWMKGEVLEQQVTYWRQQLGGAPPLLAIPTDRPRLEKPTFRGAMHRFLLPASLLESVRVLSRQQGCTGFMTMLAGFQTLVLYFTKQPDIVLGTDLANRTTVQTEGLIGFFVNLLALRTDLSGDPTFIDLLGRVREVALGAYAHQDVPFDKLVEELQPERSLSHNPLVQVLFVQQNTPRSSKSMPGLTMSYFPMDVPSKFDMAVFVTETDRGVAGNWVYSTDLFDATTIARMAGLYQLVLESAMANPALRLSELVAILAEEEQRHRASQHTEFQQLSVQKLKTVKRKTLT